MVKCRAVPGDRRAVSVALRPAGSRLVRTVTRRRRGEVARIVAAMPAAQRLGAEGALRAFAEAAGEVPEHGWWLGFAMPDEDENRT